MRSLAPMKWLLLATALCIGATKAMPQIPAQWEECELGRCKNEGVCFSDGTSEFCVCPEGYGGRQCERLLDSIRILDSEIHPRTLLMVCALLSIVSLALLVATVVGWACCCSKHLNARRLYWRNMELLKENRTLRDENRRHSHRGMRLFASLQRAHSLIAEEEEEEEAEAPEENCTGHVSQCDNTSLRREIEDMHAELRQAIEEEEAEFMTSLQPADPNSELETLMKESREAREGRRRAASLNFPLSTSTTTATTRAPPSAVRQEKVLTDVIVPLLA